VVGKGGVGKTTTAALVALACASEGYRTLAVSLDPAHNLGDVLGLTLGHQPSRVCLNLFAQEVDLDRVVREYLEAMVSRLKSLYSYLTAFNLEQYLDSLRYSPGIEEQATLEALKEILRERGKYDILIFDTPPTGLMLRVMALPALSLLWLERLSRLRERILEGRRAIERVHGERKWRFLGGEVVLPATRERDPVMQELLACTEEVVEVRRMIEDSEHTGVVMVMNAERLPLMETERALAVLSQFHIPVSGIVINRLCALSPERQDDPRCREEAEVIAEVKMKYPRLKLLGLPLLTTPPGGIEALEYLGGKLCEL